jgi:hypothetical protein
MNSGGAKPALDETRPRQSMHLWNATDAAAQMAASTKVIAMRIWLPYSAYVRGAKAFSN